MPLDLNWKLIYKFQIIRVEACEGRLDMNVAITLELLIERKIHIIYSHCICWMQTEGWLLSLMIQPSVLIISIKYRNNLNGRESYANIRMVEKTIFFPFAKRAILCSNFLVFIPHSLNDTIIASSEELEILRKCHWQASDNTCVWLVGN